MTQWKFQYRAFGEQDPADVRDSLASSGMIKRDQEVTDIYVVGLSNTSVRVRDGQIKVKGHQSSVDAVVDEIRDDRYNFPIESRVVNEAIGAKKDFVGRSLKKVDDLEKHAASKKDVIVTGVKKKSAKYERVDLEVEVTAADISGRTVHTVCIASNEPEKIHSALIQHKVLSWPGASKMEYAEAIRKYNS
jgi:hypothetical protein